MNRKDILEAAHTVWASFWASEVEERGGNFPPGAILNDLAPRLDERKLLPVFLPQLHQMDEAVEKAVGRDRSTRHKCTHEVEMDEHIPPEDQERYLMLVVMGCLGHGISPGDDWADLPDYLEHPCGLDDSPWYGLTDGNLGQPDEVYVKNSGLKCPVCGSAAFGHSPDVSDDDTVTRVECYCTVCKSQWVDEYKLTGYTNLEIGVNAK